MQTELQEQPIPNRSLLDCLDGLSQIRFTMALYVLRWIVVVPLSYLLSRVGISQNGVSFSASPKLLFSLVILDPILETFLECALPYGVMSLLRIRGNVKRPWGFVLVSGFVMAALHLDYGPSAFILALVTGCFLAYTYGHFAARGFWPAMWFTCVFHGGINFVGYLLIFGIS